MGGAGLLPLFVPGVNLPSGEMSVTLVHQFLDESASRRPEKRAVAHRATELSYAEFAAKSRAFAAGLLELGFLKGDRAVVWLPNSIETCIAIFGTLMAGGAFVPVHRSTKAEKLLSLVADCRPAVLVTDPAGSVAFDGVRRRLSRSTHLISALGDGPTAAEQVNGGGIPFDHLMEGAASTRPLPRVIDRDLAALIYTSGSTGVPKGVMSAHYNIVAAANAITAYLGNTSDDVIYTALPLSFDYGLYQLLMTVLFGGGLVLDRTFAFPAKAVETMRTEGVTGFPGVPSMFSMLLQLPPEELSLPSLRYVTNTGAALPVDHIKELERRLPKSCRIFSMYGQTECKRTLYLPPDDLRRKPASVGIPIPGEEAFLVDDRGDPVKPGERGELCVRGANVMLGYWERPEESARVFPPGPLPGERILRTGDLFYQDEEGYFYFVSRKDSIIKSRGQKVSPKEVEASLYQIPGVVEAAVIGAPHPLWGEAVEAHVALAAGSALTERDVVRHCRRTLEDFMVPERVAFRRSLPRTESGKINHAAIREERLAELRYGENVSEAEPENAAGPTR